ncbi:glycoside hydrolase family 5 protein [Pseudoduganella sp. HUAS MS19]
MNHDNFSPDRRTVLTSLLGAAMLAACGGGDGSMGARTAAASQSPALSSDTARPSRLTLNGASMRLPNGKAVTLRGMNEGTWGEMLQKDATDIAAQGATVVRVLIRWWGRYGTPDIESRATHSPGHFDPDNLKRFLKEIQWCIDAGLWVIPVIDSNCGQNGLQDAGMAAYCDPAGSYPGGHNFWSDLAMRQEFKEAWLHLAGILKDYSNIAFYELLPEPLEGRGPAQAAQVSAFYQELMAAIDSVDRRTPFLIGARDAYNISLCDEAYIDDMRWKDRVVYTGNLFLRTEKSQQENIANLERRLAALVSMRDNRNVPVFIQQFGVRTGDDPGNFYLDAGLSRMNAAGVGYTGWQWRQNTTNPDEYAVVVEDPLTHEDKVKHKVLAVYSRYWRA